MLIYIHDNLSLSQSNSCAMSCATMAPTSMFVVLSASAASEASLIAEDLPGDCEAAEGVEEDARCDDGDDSAE